MEITIFKKRVFVWLDDGWYLLNEASETKDLYLDRHELTIVRNDGIEVTYSENLDNDDEVIFVRALSKEGVIMYDLRLVYDVFKYTSGQIVDRDDEGRRLYNMLNDSIYNNPEGDEK